MALEHGRAVDPYNLAAMETKHREAAAAIEYQPDGTPDTYGLLAQERRRAAGAR